MKYTIDQVPGRLASAKKVECGLTFFADFSRPDICFILLYACKAIKVHARRRA